MIEKIGHVKNPLTVIAIFAGIAEISGTVVLPFLEKDNQEVYIWFLMLFPFFLVAVFFLTLNFNHRTLYSPSDYRDEKNFVSSVVKVTALEQGEKLRKEVQEVEADLRAEKEATEATEGAAAVAADTEVEKKITLEAPALQEVMPTLPLKPVRVASDVELAHKLAVAQLSKYTGIELRTDLRIEMEGAPTVVYDAFGIKDGNAHAVDVKYLPTQQPNANRFFEIMEKSAFVSHRMRKKNAEVRFMLHLFIVTDASDIAVKNLTLELFEMASKLDLRLEVHTRSFTNLVENDQLGSS